MRGRLSCLTHVLVLLPLFAYASVRAETPAASIEILSDSCGGKRLATPLGGALQLFSAFNASKDHFGVDFASKDQPVLAVAPGTVETVGWNLRSLPTANARSGLRVRGWGQYVILRHEDGSRSLYAHLEKDSTSKLKPGQLVSTGDLLAKSDTSGGASGPHLHFEYAPNGKIFSNVSKLDPWLCIAQQGELKAESRKPKAIPLPQRLFFRSMLATSTSVILLPTTRAV